MEHNRVNTDVVVVGGGPAGYVAAIRLGQLGCDALLVEREFVGGTCLNVGCIPSKVLIAAGRSYQEARDGAARGILGGEHLHVDLHQLMEFKEGVVKRLTSGVRALVKAHGTRILEGTATFQDANTLLVEGEETTEIIFNKALVCTGSEPIEIPSLKPNGKGIIGSREALSLRHLPKSLLVVGGGSLGSNWGSSTPLLVLR